MKIKKSVLVIWLAILMAIGLAVYFTSLQIPYYADDYQFVFDLSPKTSFHTYFYSNNAENSFYRPLQACFLWIVQRNFGLNTIPVHLTQIVMHVLLAWLVFIFLLDLGFTKIQSALSSLFMLVSQANAHSILSNDTFSQTGSTLFGFLAVWLIVRSHITSQGTPRDVASRNRYYILSMIALALSYLSKESGISFFPIVMAVIAILTFQEGLSSVFSKILRKSVPFVLLTIVYLLARSLVAEAQPSFGSGGYDFRIGANLFQNAAMFLFAAFSPVSSVAAYEAVKGCSPVAVSILIAMSLCFLLAVGCGLWSARERYRTFLLFGVFFTIALFPVMMLNHVSELYGYNSMPIASALFGVGLGRCFELTRKKCVARFAIINFILLLFTSHIIATESKAHLMKQNGERANALLNQIQPLLKDVPVNGRLLLLNPTFDKIEYSIFLMNGFNVLENGLHRFNQLADRYDFSIEIVDSLHTEQEAFMEDCLVLSLSNGFVQVESSEFPNNIPNKIISLTSK